jgi:NAD-dependent deacetylase
VQPAARLPLVAKQAGANLAIVNQSETPLDDVADVRVAASAGPTLAALAAAVVGTRCEVRNTSDE